MHSGGAANSLSASNTTDAPTDVAASIPESANVYRTPNSSPKAPRIATSKSASAMEMEMMVNPSPSQEAFKALTRASSFHGYPCGDTQPMESQVYRDFNESRVKFATTTPKKDVENTYQDDGERACGTVTTDKSLKTCVEGDTGYIDLSVACPSPGAASVSSVMGDILTSPRFGESIADVAALPKTPNLAGHKRNRSGEILTSITTNREQPAYSQFFGQNVPMMTTTQLFNQTQAPSSPIPDGPRSDPVVTRPSPNVHHQFSASSPSLHVSSPFVSMRPVIAGGPRDHYTSVFESQQLRNKSRSSVEFGIGMDVDDAILDEDEENDTARQYFEYKRMQKAKNEQAMHEFERFRAPSRAASRPRSSPTTAAPIDLRTPATIKTGDPFEFEPSEDGDEHDESHNNDEHECIEIEQEEHVNVEDDEYDELGQTVLRSQDPEAEDFEEAPATDHHALEYDGEEIINADVVSRGTAGHHEPENSISHFQLVNQDIAIADSQPTRDKQEATRLSHAANDAPLLSSYVLGSQHVHSTAVDQLPKAIASLDRVVLSSNQNGQRDLISSPTLPVASSLLRRASVEPLSARIDATSNQARDSTIPESDLPDLEPDQDQSSLKITAESTEGVASNNANVFSTAATHLSQAKPSPKKGSTKASPLKLLANQRSTNASQSPLRAAGVRHFADLAAQQSLSRGESRETDIDVDALMSDFIPEEEQQYLEAVSSPPPKRRRLNRANVANLVPLPNTSGKCDQHGISSDGTSTAVETDRSNVINADGEQRSNARTTSALQESPSKANEMPPPTQDSVVEREKAGAIAVSQLISQRSTKANKSISGDVKPTAKRVVLKNFKKSKPVEVNRQQQDLTNAFESVEGADQGDNHGVETPQGPPAEAETISNLPPAISTPDRVFALFKGSYNKFYPAIWLGSTADGSAYHVKFNDAPPSYIETQHVRKLELHLGDQVKVDIKEMRNQKWIVRGFGNIAVSSSEPAADSDIYGHGSLKVEGKSGRSSLPKNKGNADASELVEVPLSVVYLTHTLWPQFTDRVFIPPNASSALATNGATPPSSMQTAKSETPTTKARRTIIPSAKAAGARTLHPAAESVSLVTGRTAVGMFAGMVFALSYGQNDGEKEEVASFIRRHGGLIVEHGFDELFDLPSLDDVNLHISSNVAPDDEEAGQISDVAFQLKEDHKYVEFAALIADKHSRRAKYVQALALGLPTLSGRWIMDCLNASKNKTLSTAEALPLPWSRYLLPAGESMYLNGAIRSRTMPAYPCGVSSLQETINQREVLLSGDGVLIVTPKKGKANLERSKTYAFLTLALGASNVKRVSDLQEAKVLISEQPEIWKWIYVDGSVAAAGETVFGRAKEAGKKRKRDDEPAKTDLDKTFVGNGKVKIVNDEFVIQSLILGALVD